MISASGETRETRRKRSAISPNPWPHLQNGAAAEWRILVAEENANLRQALQHLLTHRGYQVAVAGHAIEALNVAAKIRPHLAILDLGTKGCDNDWVGECLQQARETEGIRLIGVFSGNWFFRPHRQISIFSGAIDTPFGLGRFLRVVEDCLRTVRRDATGWEA